MKVTVWGSALLAPTLALGVLTGHAAEEPVPSPPPASPPFLSEEGKEKKLSAPSLRASGFAPVATKAGATGRTTKSTVRPEISAAIRRAFLYSPPAPRMEAAPGATTPDSDVVEMKPVHVAGIFEGVDRVVGERERKANEEAFNFKDGGTIMKIGPADLKLKYNPAHKGWDILNMRW